MEAFYEIPWPPSVNSYWRHGPHGTYLNKSGREFRKAGLEWISRQEQIKFGSARVSVVIQLLPPDKRRRDLDNHLKACLDLLTHAGIIDDDEQIDCLKVLRDSVTKDGAAFVSIATIEQRTT